MTDVASLIADMVRSGVDPDLIGRTAAALAEREAVIVPDEAAERRRSKDRERKRLRKSAEIDGIHGMDDAGSLPSKEGPHTPKETQPTLTPIPPKGVPFPKADTAAALQAYSEMAAASGLALPRAVTAGRRARLDAVLREHGLATWVEAVGKVGASSFCRGDNDRGWKADLDFLLQAKSFTKILEGHYDDRPKARGSPQAFGIDAFLGAVIDQQERNHERPDAEIEGYPPPARLLR